MNCIDLKAQFGDRYRLGTDPSIETTRVPIGRTEVASDDPIPAWRDHPLGGTLRGPHSWLTC